MNSNEPIHRFMESSDDDADNKVQLNLSEVSVQYDRAAVVEKVSLDLRQGQIGCLLGPSGCGKTTLLRAIAGFESVTHGRIELAGHQVSAVNKTIGPELRKVGMVFQDFALFPHLTVRDNVGFGIRSLDRQQKQYRVNELLQMVGLAQYEKKYPHELSGGQQQRVALARALAPKPDILLLDEPFSGLDSSLREQLAKDVRDLLKKYQMTAVFVTHDQQEAFALADIVGVMDQGRLQQWNSPYQIYHNPSNRFVANFVGEGCVLNAIVNERGELENGLGILANGEWETQQDYGVLIRPDDLVYDAESEQSFPIIDKMFRGAEYVYQLQLPDQQSVLCVTPSHVDIGIGDHLPIVIDLQHLVVFCGR